MELGIITAPYAENFEKTKRRGLAFVEFCINVNQNVEEFVARLDSLKTASETFGVKVGSIGRWGSDRIDTRGVIQEELDTSYRLIDAASYLKCPNFVCGCNYVEELSYYDNCTLAIDYFTRLLEHGKTKGVNISVYNCHWNNFVHNEMAWRVIHGHLSELGIKFDPSHSRYAGSNYLKEIRDWGERFYHVHIKGSLMIDGKRLDDPPAGLDQTDWGTFIAILHAVKYRGGLSIEPHSANWRGEIGEQGVDFSIQFMKNLLHPLTIERDADV